MTVSEEAKLFRLAHISDLHFSSPTLSPMQFFSKRWVGNANLLLRRIREFNHDKVFNLAQEFQKNKVDFVLVSGDLSTTSRICEFERAQSFLRQLSALGIQVITLPGNHDHYTKKDFKRQTFYHYFDSFFCDKDSPFADYNLKNQKVTVKKLSQDVWLVVLDTALATSLFACNGDFSEQIEQTLREVLAKFSATDKVIVANHFPIFTSDQKNKHLLRDYALRQVLSEYPQIKFYLHGHTHRHSVADLRNAGLPIILDSGCTAHENRGSWNLLEFFQSHCEVTSFKWNYENSSCPLWQKQATSSFKF